MIWPKGLKERIEKVADEIDHIHIDITTEQDACTARLAQLHQYRGMLDTIARLQTVRDSNA